MFKKKSIKVFIERHFPLSLNIYRDYANKNQEYHFKNKKKSYWYLLKLLLTPQKIDKLMKVKAPKVKSKQEIKKLDYRESSANKRPSQENFVKAMAEYDIISFDIFDTAILRRVESPRDVFTIMAIEMGCPTFKSIRITAEEIARRKLYGETNCREVNIGQIYDVLEKKYNIERRWLDREIELEIDLCEANPYFLSIYNELIRRNKRIIFTSDMYLPYGVIAKILKKNGYTKYEKLFLSNDLKLSKTDGTMWRYISEDYAKGHSVFHVGDNYNADIVKSNMFGIETTYYHSVRELAKPYREEFINNLGGSFFRAVVNNSIHCGNWRHSFAFEHGFRVGGILTYGYCEFISKKAKEINADLIIFCARDCEIIQDVYARYFNDVENKYIKISRYAILNITIDRYLDDLLARIFNKELDNAERATMRELFRRAGLSYLIDIYAEMGNNPDEQLNIKNIDKVKDFIRDHLEIIIKNNQPQIDAAKVYFGDVVGQHKNILIVDVGWTGSCITMLDYFLNSTCNFDCNIHGTLLIGNNNDVVSANIMNNKIDTYLISPTQNLDLLRLQFKKDKWQTEMNNQMMEYMFTSTDDSLLEYKLLNNNKVDFIYNKRMHVNDVDILEMHNGVLAFADKFSDYTRHYKGMFFVSPYVASGAFYKSLASRDYCNLIYGKFAYDATVGNNSFGKLLTFKDVYSPRRVQKSKEKMNVLLVSHSFTVSGAPRSLLRIGKVLVKLGYNVEVWSPYGGGIVSEYEVENISVRIVKPEDLYRSDIKEIIEKFDFAICNTILTNEYYSQIRKFIPTVWYIREATNVPDYCSNQKEPVRYYDLCSAKDLICVSDYAASALKTYNRNVKVLRNCIEDEADKALPYKPSTDRIKFIQLGSLEYRKGFDVILDAYDRLPDSYKEKCEFYFAGQIITSASDYATNILNRVRKINNMHYLGVIKDQREKTETISSMDVVVVASRDESCSLVALEGAMLSKPLIVTKNVGAKYIVEEGKNGFVVETGSAEDLARAIRYFIDHNSKLVKMGYYSRVSYEERANMDRYTEDIKALVEKYIPKKKSEVFKRYVYRVLNNTLMERCRLRRIFKRLKEHAYKEELAKSISKVYPSLSDHFMKKAQHQKLKEEYRHYKNLKKNHSVIVSLTSYPARIKKLEICLQSLLNQVFKPDKVILWLAKSQFPNGLNDLPKGIRVLASKGLSIEWCDEDLKPHKKYFYAMLKYPESIVITVDDDMVYSPILVGKLYESYLKHPNAVSCLRAHLIKFNENGTVKRYVDWGMEDNTYIDTPAFNLLPTGVSGVLYPPHCLPEAAFNIEKIKEVAFLTDDLWLKVMSVANGYPAVLVERQGPIHGIEGTQESAISLFNNFYGNDNNMKKCLNYCDKLFGQGVIESKLMKE